MVSNRLPWVLVFFAASLAAQTSPPPLGLPGEVPLSSVEPKISRNNMLTMGLRISSSFDDNALSSNQDRQGNVVALLEPHVEWRVSRSRLEWSLDYSPSLSRSQRFSVYDSLSQVLDSGLQATITKRLKVRIHENFLKSTNPFDQLREPQSEPGSVTRDLPNGFVSASATQSRVEQADVDVVYALGAHSTAGVIGEFFSARYSLPPAIQFPLPALQETRSWGGHAFYTRQITRHQRIGFDYHAQKLILKGGQSSRVQSVVYSHAIALSRSMGLSVFVGPEHTIIENESAGFSALLSNIPGSRATWSWTGGATYSWSGPHTSLSAGFYRRTSDGGFLGAVQLSRSTVELRRQFARQWTASLLGSYDNSKALGNPGTLSYASAASGLTYVLSQGLSVEFQYWRVHSSSQDSLPGNLLADHNRISASLIYDFRRPLGR